jgi:LysM repeat protein
MDEGSQAFVRGDSQTTRERLFIIANGPEFTFFVNGELVSRVYDREYDGGNLGFIVETLDETYAHVHFDSIIVWELPAGTAAPSTPPAAGNYKVVSPLCGGSVTEANTLVSFTSHTVEEGETMSAIALEYGVTVAEIWGANGKTVDNPSLIRTGQTLVIPQPGT